ncbi:hypothetical protein BGX27_001795, partial [Mortierella sp. AM989]
EDRALVLKNQIHKCTAYCKPDPSDRCRFKYPRPPCRRRTYLSEEDGCYVLQRAEGDECVNGYNMELLRFGCVNMNLQYNQDDKAKNYMCKYVTKQAGAKLVTIVREADAGLTRDVGSSSADMPSKVYIQHFHYRSFGIVETIMDIYLPPKHKLLLKRVAALKASPDSTNIFHDDKWTKYLKRPKNVEGTL